MSNPIPINPPKTTDDRQPLVILQAIMEPQRKVLARWWKNGKEQPREPWDQPTWQHTVRASPGDVYAVRIEEVTRWGGPEDTRATLCQVVIDNRLVGESISRRGDYCEAVGTVN
jgi:hypothetical protein